MRWILAFVPESWCGRVSRQVEGNEQALAAQHSPRRQLRSSPRSATRRRLQPWASLHISRIFILWSRTTLGMVVANVPAVIIGDKLAGQLPVKAIRVTAAIVFATLGIITLSGVRL